MKTIRWVVLISLLWIGLLIIPKDTQLTVKSQTLGTQTTTASSPVSTPRPTKHKSPVSPIPTAVMSPSPTSEPQRETTPAPTISDSKDTQVLINEELTVANETHTFEVKPLSSFSKDNPLFLTVTFKIKTQENGEAFDDPAFEISADDRPVYRIAAHDLSCQFTNSDTCESSWFTRTFVIADTTMPTHISFWSGDTGDDQRPTTAIISQATVFTQPISSADSTVPAITDLKLTRDTSEFVTLEWSAPETSTAYLDRALRYEIQVDGQPASIVLPDTINLLARLPHAPEERLLKINPADSTVAIRALDWQGKPSAWSTIQIPPLAS